MEQKSSIKTVPDKEESLLPTKGNGLFSFIENSR